MRPAQTKAKIINKAREMFLNFGFKSVTMDDLAINLGISKKTIYSYFRNKTELITEITNQMLSNFTKEIDSLVEKLDEPIQQLYSIQEVLTKYNWINKSSIGYQLEKYYPKIHSGFKNILFQTLHNYIVENLKKGVKDGVYRNDLDVDFVSRLYIYGLYGINKDELFSDEIFLNTNLEESHFNYYILGITTDQGKITASNVV